MKFLICVTIYKQHLLSSSTLLSLFKCKNELQHSYILVVDNSPAAQDYEFIKRRFEDDNILFEYIHYPENKALSQIYNQAIEICKIKSLDYLCVFDQDSNFDQEFFIEVCDACSNRPIHLFLPRIYFKGKLVSPTRKLFLKGFYLQDDIQSGIIEGNYGAINSGMVISRDYLEAYKFQYDVRLKNYGTDDYFMIKYSQSIGEFYLLNYSMEHDLSLSSLNEFSSDLKDRYELMLEAWTIIYSDMSFLTRLGINVYKAIHRIYMTGKYKNFAFLMRKK